MPSADDEVFVERSQPVPAGIRSAILYVLLPSYKNGIANADEAVPTAQPDELTARADPCVVPIGRGIAVIPPDCVQINGDPEP